MKQSAAKYYNVSSTKVAHYIGKLGSNTKNKNIVNDN